MKRMTLFSTLIIAVLTLLLSACDQPTSSEATKTTPYSEQGLPLSQRQQEDSAAGVKFGKQQHFTPLAPLSEDEHE